MKKQIWICMAVAALMFVSGLVVASSAQMAPGIKVMQVDYDVGKSFKSVVQPIVLMDEPAAQCSDSCHVGYKAGIGKTAKYVDKPDGKWLASLPNVGSTAVSVLGKTTQEQRISRYG